MIRHALLSSTALTLPAPTGGLRVIAGPPSFAMTAQPRKWPAWATSGRNSGKTKLLNDIRAMLYDEKGGR